MAIEKNIQKQNTKDRCKKKFNPIYNLRAKENVINDSFGRGYMCNGFGGSLEIIHQLLVDVNVLTIQEARLQLTEVMP